MALDRQSIEKKDFPVGRRGYDPDAVDAHLAALADEVAELRRPARATGDTLASSASDQVRAIVEAAETSAAQIQRQAEGDAREIRDEASAEARSTREQATARAREYVESIAASTESLLTRLGSMQTELDSLLGSLRTGAGRLSSDLGALQSDLDEMGEVVSSRSGFAPEASPVEVFSEPAAEAGADDVPEEPSESEPEPELAPEDPFGDLLDAQAEGEEPSVAAPTSEEATEGARLIALNMALNGSSRGETERYLEDNFVLSDTEQLLDEVYASVEG